MRKKHKIRSDIAPNSLGGFPKNLVSALTCWNSVDFLVTSVENERKDSLPGSLENLTHDAT